jgi:TP53 regulating kinase and related kinases
MEYFDKASTAKDLILTIQKEEVEVDTKLDELTRRIGDVVGKLHVKNIIHCDLTTSNILVEPKETTTS